MKVQVFFLLAIIASSCVATNWFQCAQSALALVQDVYNLVQDAQSSTFNITKIISDLNTILSQVQTTQTACGLNMSVYTVETPQACFGDLVVIYQDLQSLRTAVEDNNIPQILKLATQLYNEAVKAESDCQFSEIQKQQQLAKKQKSIDEEIVGINWYACGKDVSVIVQNAAKISQEAKDYQANLPTIIEQLEVIVNYTLLAQADCAWNQDYNFLDDLPIEFQLGNYQQCVQAVIQLEQIAVQVEKDVKTFNVAQLSKDLQSLYNQTLYALSVCENSSDITLPTVEIDWAACGGDLLAIFTNVQKIVQEVQGNFQQNLPAIIVQLQNIVNTLVKAKTDCALSTLNITIPEIANIQDQQQCIAAVQQIQATAQKITTDVKTFNIAALATDLETLYQQTVYALSVCTSSSEFSY